MACSSCNGVGLCDLVSTCCLQLQQDCGEGCTDLAVGYSRVQITADGNIEICSNVGGVCTCNEIPPIVEDTLIDNANGTFTHTSVLGTAQTLNVCDMVFAGGCFSVVTDNGDGSFTHDDGFGTNVTWQGTTSVVTDNGDGTWTHNDGTGTTVTLDVCQMLIDGACIDTLVNNGDGTYTHTAVNGTAVVIDVCQAIIDGACTDILVNNGNGTFTHTAVNGTAVVIDVCQAIIDGGCSDTLVVNPDGSVTHTSVNGTVVTIPAPGTSLITFPGLGVVTHTNGLGVATNIDICALMVQGGCTDNLVINPDGSFTHTDTQGNIVTVAGPVITTLVDNADGTATYTNENGTAVVLNICQMIIDGACADTLVYNGNGTYTHTAVDGVVQIIDICQALCDDNCFGQVSVAANAFGVTQPGTWLTAADQVLSGPVCTVLTNTTDVNMVYSVKVPSTQMVANVAGVALGDVNMTQELSVNGGGTWAGTASNDTRLQPTNTGSFSEQATTTGYDFDVTLAPGATQTICVRMVARIGPTGIAPDGNIFVDELAISASGRALPVNC